MNLMSVGDMAQSLVLSRRNATLKDSIQNLSTELTTGFTVAKTERLKGDFVPIAGIEASLSQLDAYHNVTTETAAAANHMQVVLTSITDSASALSSALLAAASSNSPARINTLGFDANERLKSAMSALNTRMGERSLFAGEATDRAAMADVDTLMTALDGVVAGALSSGDVETAVDAWFADPGGFSATIYQGGDPLSAVPISADDQAQIDVTANDPALTETIKGLVLAALLQRGVLADSAVARADLAKRAGESLATSQTGLAELAARLGSTEAQIVNAGVRNSAEKFALESTRLSMLSVDPYETATKLQEAQTQLETLFSLTARMSRLSLVNYL